jgi:hypothetical protein
MNPFRAFSLLSFSLLSAHLAGAEPVWEWRFDQSDVVSGGNSVKPDGVRAGAAEEAQLLPASSISAEETGLGRRWQKFLGTGFLDVTGGSGASSGNQHGLATDTKPSSDGNTNYRRFMGFSGFGTGDDDASKPRGGTLYLVLSPRDWAAGTRYGLFGTGHAGDGAVTLTINKNGALVLSAGSKASSASASIDAQWDADQWYFIAASWRQDEAPVLVVHPMSPDGKAKSAPAVQGIAEGVSPAADHPQYDPLVVGSAWYNPGADATARDGANARFAWVRLENTFNNVQEMDTVFQGLSAE